LLDLLYFLKGGLFLFLQFAHYPRKQNHHVSFQKTQE